MQQSDYLKLHYINVKPHEFKFDNNVRLTWVKPTQYFTKRVNMTSGIVPDIGNFSNNHHFEMYTMYHKVHIVHTKSKQWWSQEELHMPSFCLGFFKCSGSTILHDIYKERWYPLVGVNAIPLPGFYRLPSCQIFNAKCQEGWNDYQFSSFWSDPAVLTTLQTEGENSIIVPRCRIYKDWSILRV